MDSSNRKNSTSNPTTSSMNSFPRRPHLLVGLPVDTFGRGQIVGNRHSLMQYIPNHVLFTDSAHGHATSSLPFPQVPAATPVILGGLVHPSQSPSQPHPGTRFCPIETKYSSLADSNASLSKKKGATGPQVFLPPRNQLNCHDFYLFKKSDKRRISAMMIGVTKAEYGIELCLDQEPFVAFAREIRPTNLCLQEELIRRATLQNARVLPRPAQWEKDKILTVLKESYPPKLTNDDLLFLQQQVARLFEIYSKKREDMNKKGWFSIDSHLRFYHVLLNNQNQRDSVPIESDLFWKNVSSLMNNPDWIPRSIALPQVCTQFSDSHDLLFLFNETLSIDALKSQFESLRKSFHAHYDTETHELTSSTFNEDTDASITSSTGPNSSPLSHEPSSTPSALLLYFQTLMQQRGFDPIFFNLPITCIGIQASDGLAKSVHLLESSVMGEINSNDDGNALEEASEENEDNREVPTINEATIDENAPQLQSNDDVHPATTQESQVSKGEERDATEETSTTTNAMPIVTETKTSQMNLQHQGPFQCVQAQRNIAKEETEVYLASSRLLLDQMEFYNKIENELLALEEKRLLHTTWKSKTDAHVDSNSLNDEKHQNHDEDEQPQQQHQHQHELQRAEKVYRDFHHRKEESLRLLKRQVLDMAEHAERCSKRLRMMEGAAPDDSR